ncbi:MAG: hypothetical protein Q4B92_06480, partial [Ruminococcus sp.]|nr:hypothetical protein [Ruminococcus sp.]
MNFYKCVSKTKAALIWVGVLSFISGLFIFSTECKDGATNGVLLCLGVLVPSLFPFFILSSFLAESEILDCLSPVLNPAAKLIMGTRGICLVPVILGILGGYPVGARAISALYAKGSIDKNEADRLSCICCSAGPGFLVTFVGVSLLNSKEAGIILLSSQIISIAVLCVLSRFIFGKGETNNKKPLNKPKTSVSEALVSSVNSAVKSAAGMCGFVIAFSVICNVLTEGFGVSNALGKIFISTLEITTGVSMISGEVSLELLSALTGFGGICVHMQIFRELKGIEFSKVRFYIFRLIQSGISLVTAKLLLLVFT